MGFSEGPLIVEFTTYSLAWQNPSILGIILSGTAICFPSHSPGVGVDEISSMFILIQGWRFYFCFLKLIFGACWFLKVVHMWWALSFTAVAPSSDCSWRSSFQVQHPLLSIIHAAFCCLSVCFSFSMWLRLLFLHGLDSQSGHCVLSPSRGYQGFSIQKWWSSLSLPRLWHFPSGW